MKKKKKSQSNIKNLWDNIKYANLCIIGISEGEEGERGTENVFEEIMAGKKKKKERNHGWRSHYGATGSATSVEHWDSGLIPGLAQWVKDLALPQLLEGSQPQLESDP